MYVYFFGDLVCLLDRERGREHWRGERQGEGAGEAGCPRNRETDDAGLDGGLIPGLEIMT